MLAIKTESLSFQYKKKEPILSDINLSVPSGAVFGLLGQNGAGKTTLLKLLLGLLPNRKGSITLLGKRPTEKKVFHQVGNLIEGPHLYHHLSGRQNLELFVHYRQLEKQVIDVVLKKVGLIKQADKKVGQYSTGMKQRLAIGIALLSDPHLLILDEPTNGLDPEGIADIRHLIRHLSKDEHRTIIFSSHLLSEMEQVCTHIGILKNGTLIFQDTYEKLREQRASSETVFFLVKEVKRALAILEKNSWPAKIDGKKICVRIEDPSAITRIIDLLREADIAIFRIESEENQLEHLFLIKT